MNLYQKQLSICLIFSSLIFSSCAVKKKKEGNVAYGTLECHCICATGNNRRMSEPEGSKLLTIDFERVANPVEGCKSLETNGCYLRLKTLKVLGELKSCKVRVVEAL